MEAARAASSGKTESNKKSPSRAEAITTCIASLMFVWFATRALRRCSGAGAKEENEQLVSAVVWALSPAICAYLFVWTVALSGLTVGVTTLCLFARVTFLPLLAGAAAMFLATVYSAVKAGRALSFRRQRAGTERSAAAAAATSAPSYRSRAEDDHDRSVRTFIAVVMVLLVGGPFAGVSLEPSEPQGGEAVLGVFMLGAGPFLLAMRHLQLEESPLQANTVKFVLSLVPAVIGCIVVTEVAGGMSTPVVLVVVWAAALAMAGIFGYGRALEAQYERLVATKRREPRTAQDASGLLVGRDEEDACSAHIDAATAICLDCVLPKQSRCTCGSHKIIS